MKKIKTDPPLIVVQGSNLHSAYQVFFNLAEHDILKLDKNKDQFTFYFFDLLLNNIPKHVAIDEYCRQNLYHFASIEAKMLLKAKSHFDDVNEAIRYWRPIENGIELKIKSPNLKLNGVVDRIDRMYGGKHDGKLIVIDYKTGNVPPKVTKKDGSEHRPLKSDVRRQMCYYKLLAEEHLKENVELIMGFYTKEGVTIPEPIKKITLTKAIEKRDKALETIESCLRKDNFEYNIGSRCFSSEYSSGCEFYEICRSDWTSEMLLKAREELDGAKLARS